MEKKATLLLKWGRAVIVLLGVMVFAIGGNFHIAKADTTQTCQLSWFGTGVQLNMGTVPQDIQTALTGAHLTNCTNAADTSCTLVQGGGDTALNFDNIQSTSGVLITSLKSDHIGLNCLFPSSGSGSQVVSSGSISRVYTCKGGNDGYFNILSDNGVDWDCFSQAGTLAVKIYAVSQVCTGNNTGYVVLDVGGGNSERFDFTSKSTCYSLPLGHEITQITIN